MRFVAALFVACLTQGCKPERHHPMSFRITGPIGCKVGLTSEWTGNDVVTLPWGLEGMTGVTGAEPRITAEWGCERCSADPGQTRCEIWLDGRLWRWGRGEFVRRGRVGSSVTAGCFVGGHVDVDPPSVPDLPTAEQSKRQSELGLAWAAQVEQNRRAAEWRTDHHMGPTSCVAGYGDCDGNRANGCEADLSANASHCGSCGLRCGRHQRCRNGVCE